HRFLGSGYAFRPYPRSASGVDEPGRRRRQRPRRGRDPVGDDVEILKTFDVTGSYSHLTKYARAQPVVGPEIAETKLPPGGGRGKSDIAGAGFGHISPTASLKLGSLNHAQAITNSLRRPYHADAHASRARAARGEPGGGRRLSRLPRGVGVPLA